MPTDPSAPPLPTLRSEDEIALYYWPKTHGEPPAWFRAAISDAFDTGIAFAVRRRDGLVEAAKAEGR